MEFLFGDEGSFSLDTVDQSLFFQSGQGIADGNTADTELLAQFPFRGKTGFAPFPDLLNQILQLLHKTGMLGAAALG